MSRRKVGIITVKAHRIPSDQLPPGLQELAEKFLRGETIGGIPVKAHTRYVPMRGGYPGGDTPAWLLPPPPRKPKP